MVLNTIYSSVASHAHAALANAISTALVFMSLGTTVSATFLIGYRIHTTSQTNIFRSKRAYNRIVATIIESSAAYSLMLLLYAMTSVIPPFYTISSPLTEVGYYLAVLLLMTAVRSIYNPYPFSDTENFIREWLQR